MNIDKLNLATLYFLELIKSSCKKTDDAKSNIIVFFFSVSNPVYKQ